VTRIYNRSFRAEDINGNPLAGAQVTLWDSKTDGLQLTDGITDLSANPIPGGVLVCDAWGFTPDFQDTLDRPDVWAIGSVTGAIPGVERVLLESSSDDTRISALETTTTDLDDRLTAVEAAQADATNAPTFNVITFGAVGDGATDSRTAIQAAIDEAAGTGGGVVLFPPGVYLIGDTLILKTGVTLQGGHGTGWPFRFPDSPCVIMCSSTFAGECAISLLGADITGSPDNEGNARIFDLDLSGELLPAGSVSGIHAQGEVMDVVLARMTIKRFTHNGIHTNIGTGTKPPHDWFMDSVVCYDNASFGFSLSMTDGYIRDCIASSNGLDGWLLTPLGSLVMTGCQALFNGQHGFNIAGGAQVGNLTMVGPLTDRNDRDGIHLGTSTGSGSPPIVITGAALNRDGRNGNTGGAAYAGLRIDGCANPVIVNGVTVNTGVDDDGSGVNSPQYGASLTGANAYVQLNSGYLHGNTAGLNNDNTTVVFRRFNVDEATGPKNTPTFVYGQGVVTEGTSLSVPGHALGIPKPSEHSGAIAWTTDPTTVNGADAATNGTVYLSALYVHKTVTATKLFWGITTPGASPIAGQNFIGLYDATGARLANVGVDARVTTSNGFFTETINVNLKPGLYWVAWVFNASTPPQLMRGPNINNALINFNLAAANLRYATNLTGQTALPSPLVPANNVTTNARSFWAAIA
jgi:hypothetical protein